MIGVIFVGRTEVAHDFSDEDRLLAEAIAHLAAQAIENARLYTESRNQARQLQISNHLARKVSTSLVRSEVLDVAVSSALELTGADRAMIVLRQADGSLSCEMARDAQGPLDPSTIAYSQSLCQKVLATEEPIIHLDTAQHEDLKAQRSIMANELRTVMGVPLMGRTEPMGVLYVDSQKVVNAFGPAELDLLGAIGSQAAIAITNAQLYEKATVDALTRLYVRSFFEQRLLHEVNRALRYGSSVSVLMMDIDHFKKFNDTYGHAVGDQVLRHVAGVIKGAIRQDLDVAARFGGEEMLVLMPDTGPDGAVATAERLRQAIASSGLEQAAGDPLQVMVSIGVSSLSPELSTPVELIEAADAALYQSKRNGRNRVTAFEPGMTAKI
jgi:diguanylate cyclase (GGDEF)-like protein